MELVGEHAAARKSYLDAAAQALSPAQQRYLRLRAARVPGG